ncbi:UDP-glucose dehydrogenase family protein [Brachybacterium hainanense]|uniref:UDP-glucose 6-dehydrogenase n=1 Tax=Brachybacterium hainanense TaxID=1541174 RepID=A0ABV6RCL9_9MICO
MRISVIGCGYLGAVHAACLAHAGHEVVGIDRDESRARALQDGAPPFYEPGLQELLREGLDAGRLSFTDDPRAAQGAAVHFLCVGTPQMRGGDATDLGALRGAVASLLPSLRPGQVVVGKSTVPVGTAEEVARTLRAACPEVGFIWNPEFLRESTAVEDTLHPERMVYGVEGSAAGADGSDPSGSGTAAAAIAALDAVYAPQLQDGVPRMITDLATAQLVKVAANSFLAVKISFINAMAQVSEASGADVDDLADALGMDERIGRRFLDAGLGFGGGCLPKDLRGFRARARELGADGVVDMLTAAETVNESAREDVLSLAARMLEDGRETTGAGIIGARIAVLGATFKPGSDDVRESPALALAARLEEAGAEVVVADPQGVRPARAAHPGLAVTDDLDGALAGADVLVLATAWPEYRDLDPQHAASLVAGRRIVDARGAMPLARWQEAGWDARSLGRRMPRADGASAPAPSSAAPRRSGAAPERRSTPTAVTAV